MEFSWVRYFSRGFVILICCCGAIAFGSAASIDATDFANWVQLSPANSPPARSYLAMTYDAASGKVIMFGGSDANGYLNDTWTFDGVTWTQVMAESPPPARAAAKWPTTL
jgi:Galactose oxidase, central domain